MLFLIKFVSALQQNTFLFTFNSRYLRVKIKLYDGSDAMRTTSAGVIPVVGASKVFV